MYNNNAFFCVLVAIAYIYNFRAPLQFIFSKKFGKLRDQAVQHTDQRLKLINEALIGCMAMKMYCWEKSLIQSIRQSRALEMKYIKRAAMIQAVNFGIFGSSSVLIALVIFFPYFYTHNKLEPSVIYPILTFFTFFKLGTAIAEIDCYFSVFSFFAVL